MRYTLEEGYSCRGDQGMNPIQEIDVDNLLEAMFEFRDKTGPVPLETAMKMMQEDVAIIELEENGIIIYGQDWIAKKENKIRLAIWKSTFSGIDWDEDLWTETFPEVYCPL